jgi:putative molybdopterin biosynthesis protein
MAKRNLNLNIVPVEEALFKYFSALEGLLVPGFEKISAEESLNRITSGAVCARLNSPHYNAAAMDGIAVRSAAAIDAGESNPVALKEGDDFICVNTGDPVHAPYDAVIMAEYLIHVENEQSVKITKSAFAGQHVRFIGENIKTGEVILPAKHKIRPVDIGMLLSAGVIFIEVFSKPRVAIFPTGSELIDPFVLAEGEIPKDGAIIESNSRMIEAQVKQAGGQAVRFPPVPDNFEKLKDKISRAALEFDMILINAGSSAGTQDFAVQVLREIGEVIVHGVAMKPGKPVILAKVNNKPVICTPGYPVSAYLTFEKFAAPVLSVLTGRAIKPARKINAVLSERIISSLNRREYVRVKLENVNDRLTAFPLARNSGVALSLVKADGFCVIEQGNEAIEAGETVTIELMD